MSYRKIIWNSIEDYDRMQRAAELGLPVQVVYNRFGYAQVYVDNGARERELQARFGTKGCACEANH